MCAAPAAAVVVIEFVATSAVKIRFVADAVAAALFAVRVESVVGLAAAVAVAVIVDYSVFVVAAVVSFLPLNCAF